MAWTMRSSRTRRPIRGHRHEQKYVFLGHPAATVAMVATVAHGHFTREMGLGVRPLGSSRPQKRSHDGRTLLATVARPLRDRCATVLPPRRGHFTHKMASCDHCDRYCGDPRIRMFLHTLLARKDSRVHLEIRGGADVGASCLVLSAAGRRILIDAGVPLSALSVVAQQPAQRLTHARAGRPTAPLRQANRRFSASAMACSSVANGP
jgi:hypothetical protein